MGTVYSIKSERQERFLQPGGRRYRFLHVLRESDGSVEERFKGEKGCYSEKEKEKEKRKNIKAANPSPITVVVYIQGPCMCIHR
jgi:hypothetical protein